MGLGLPEGWESVAQRVADTYGHVLMLAATPEAFNDNGTMIDVYLDDKLSGGFEFVWDERRQPSAVLAELWDRVTELLARDLGSGI
jgi:hypothetical protein